MVKVQYPVCLRCGQQKAVSTFPYCGTCYVIVATALGQKRWRE